MKSFEPQLKDLEKARDALVQRRGLPRRSRSGKKWSFVQALTRSARQQILKLEKAPPAGSLSIKTWFTFAMASSRRSKALRAAKVGGVGGKVGRTYLVLFSDSSCKPSSPSSSTASNTCPGSRCRTHRKPWTSQSGPTCEGISGTCLSPARSCRRWRRAGPVSPPPYLLAGRLLLGKVRARQLPSPGALLCAPVC